jgi:hypothetical protein
LYFTSFFSPTTILQSLFLSTVNTRTSKWADLVDLLLRLPRAAPPLPPPLLDLPLLLRLCNSKVVV